MSNLLENTNDLATSTSTKTVNNITPLLQEWWELYGRLLRVKESQSSVLTVNGNSFSQWQEGPDVIVAKNDYFPLSVIKKKSSLMFQILNNSLNLVVRVYSFKIWR